jgi:hypothetical protein
MAPNFSNRDRTITKRIELFLFSWAQYVALQRICFLMIVNLRVGITHNAMA